MGDVTRETIVSGIRSLGVAAGDVMLVHSSLRSLGHVDGGAKAVAEALIESVSPGGTVVVPTFNYGTLAYDPRVTPSLTGAITDALWRMSDAVRSEHPTHAFAAVGPLAAELMAGHEDGVPLGRESPLWRLWERDAWVLLIGCDHRSSTMIHLAETIMAVPYLGRTRVGRRLSGSEATEVIVGRPGCSNGFNIIDGPLRRAGQVREARVGRSKLMLMRSGGIVAAACELLRRDPAALLCRLCDCERCAWARQQIEEQAGSA